MNPNRTALCSRPLIWSLPVIFLLVMQATAFGDAAEVGVEWIVKCQPCGNSYVGCRDDCALGLYDLLRTHGFVGRFNWGNRWAWEQDFKYKTAPGGGTDYLWIDTVDIAMHSDHGAPGMFGFGESDHDGCIFYSNRARWGDQDLEWIILDDCSCLYNGDGGVFRRWRGAFQGLHLILGFYSGAHDYCSRGQLLASKLLAGWTFPQAWRYACEHTEGSASTRGAVMGTAKFGGPDSWNDHLWGHGPVTPDMPPSPSRYLWLWNFPCD